MALPMNDRLTDLRMQQSQAFFSSGNMSITSISAQSLCTPSYESLEASAVNVILIKVDDVDRMIAEISSNTEEIKLNHETILAAFDSESAKDTNEKLMGDIKSLSQQTYVELRKMKLELEQKDFGALQHSAEYRILKIQYLSLTQNFKQAMAEYHAVQESYRERSTDRIQRILRYTGKDVSYDDVEELLASQEPQLFTDDINVDTAQNRQALSEVETRHQEILHLERNIRELHNMFYDMAIMVEEQGELIDQIECNVNSAVGYVAVGAREVQAARSFKPAIRRIRWAICCCVMTVIVILLLVIIIVVCATVLPKYLNNN